MASIEVIEFDNDHGSIFGYIVSAKEEQFKNWVSSYGLDFDLLSDKHKFISEAANSNKSFAIIKSLFVENEHRNNGVGTELLDSFLSSCDIAEYIFLVSDKYEIQNNGFVLESWYNSFGFEKLEDTSSGSLLVLNI